MQEREQIKNGIPVYSYRNPALHGFYLSLYVRAGSLYECEENSGISHFTEHLLIRNVNRLMGGGLYALLDREGLEFNASTYSDMIQFYITGASEKFEVACRVFPKLLAPLVLSREEIELERRRVRAEIREGDDKTSLGTFSAKILYPAHPLSLPIVGTGSSVSRLSGKRLEAFRRRIVSRGNFFFFLTGNYEEEKIALLLDTAQEILNADDTAPREPASLSGAVSFAPSLPAANGTVALPTGFGRRGSVYVKNADFTMLRFCFDLDMTKVSLPEVDLLYDVLFAGYNSRFFIEMSENRGLFYDINGSVERYPNLGLLYFTYEVKEKDLEESVKISLRILSQMKQDLLAEEEMMKASYVDNAGLLFDDAREFNFTMAYDAHILGLGYRSLAERTAAYRDVTPARLRDVARAVFRPENLTLTMKGNKKRIDKEKLRAMFSVLDA